MVFPINTSQVTAIDTAPKQSDCQGQVYSSHLRLSVPCPPHDKTLKVGQRRCAKDAVCLVVTARQAFPRQVGL